MLYMTMQIAVAVELFSTVHTLQLSRASVDALGSIQKLRNGNGWMGTEALDRFAERAVCFDRHSIIEINYNAT